MHTNERRDAAGTPTPAATIGDTRFAESARPDTRLTRLLADIRPATSADPAAVRAHLDSLTKPPGSLGRVEELALRLALIYGDPPPPLTRRAVLLFAADHGVAARGVSAYPAEVTAQMCRNFAAGGAAINALTRAIGAEVVAVDVGVDSPAPAPAGVLDRRIRRGSRDLAASRALTRDEVLQAMDIGAALVAERAATTDVFALGEMGIGNSTAAAAVTAALTGAPADHVAGPGTGLDAAGLERKRRIVAAAVQRIGASAAGPAPAYASGPVAPDAVARVAAYPDPLYILAEVGGLEIAALAGAVLGAARAGRAVVTDGFIATASALAAVRLCPSARDYLIAAHRSPEPGHAVQLAALELRPLLDLGLRLGEGTGATLALPLLEAAAAILREMATFESAAVSGRTADT